MLNADCSNTHSLENMKRLQGHMVCETKMECRVLLCEKTLLMVNLLLALRVYLVVGVNTACCIRVCFSDMHKQSVCVMSKPFNPNCAPLITILARWLSYLGPPQRAFPPFIS